MAKADKQQLFESASIPRAVLTLSIPTVLSSLVMVLYNMADTFFVGMLNDPIQNAAVTLAAPVMLAFNAVNNLFGVGAALSAARTMTPYIRQAPLVSGVLFSAEYCSRF